MEGREKHFDRRMKEDPALLPGQQKRHQQRRHEPRKENTATTEIPHTQNPHSGYNTLPEMAGRPAFLLRQNRMLETAFSRANHKKTKMPLIYRIPAAWDLVKDIQQ